MVYKYLSRCHVTQFYILESRSGRPTNKSRIFNIFFYQSGLTMILFNVFDEFWHVPKRSAPSRCNETTLPSRDDSWNLTSIRGRALPRNRAIMENVVYIGPYLYFLTICNFVIGVRYSSSITNSHPDTIEAGKADICRNESYVSSVVPPPRKQNWVKVRKCATQRHLWAKWRIKLFLC